MTIVSPRYLRKIKYRPNGQIDVKVRRMLFRGKSNNQYCVSCEECYSSWESPQDITSKEKSFLLLDQKDVSDATLDEIAALGWEKYLSDV